MVDFSEKYKKLWNEWEIRFLVVFSLFLQTFLTICAPLRKRKTTKWIRPFIWAAYLLADWVAAFALGILSDSIDGSPECKDRRFTNSSTVNEVIAFWAPFLLVHLGGPDTITALALEDNQLWVRHLLALVVHLIGALYVFVLTLPNNRLLFATLIIFLVGIVRYIERTLALYIASSSGFGLSRPTEDIELKDLVTLKKVTIEERGEVTSIEVDCEPDLQPDLRGIDGIEKVQSAHRFLATYKHLIVNRLLSFHEREESRSYFLGLHPKGAFGIIEVELGLLFDMLYTKATVIHSRMGYISRAICFSSILAALLFFIPFDKRGSHHVDKIITYALLLGAMAIDIVAFLYLISSNWMVASPRNTTARRLASKMFAGVFTYGPPRRPTYMSQYNLMSYCLRSCWASKKKMADRLRIGNFIEHLAFTQDVVVSAQLKAFIFHVLRNKSIHTNSLEDIKNISVKRWDWIIDEHDSEQMPRWFFNLELEECILLWHIATNFYYHQSRKLAIPKRNFSKLLSDYMYSLLVMHPTMISSMEGIPQIKWQDVGKQVMNFIRETRLKEEEDLCRKLINEVSLTEFYGPRIQRTETLLTDACLVAKKLLRQDEDRAWNNISRVWVELLSCAANRCSGKDHAQRLVEGGEFLTSVWLMNAHLGLAEQYRAEFSNP